LNLDAEFLDGISRLKKILILKAAQRIFLWSSVVFFVIFTIAAGVQKTGFVPVDIFGFFLVICISLSLLAALTSALIKRRTFTEALIDIDSRLNLKDRISTAYEYCRQGPKSELAHLLIKDAGHRLSRLSHKQIFPPKLSLLHVLLGFLILTDLILFSVGFFAWRLEKTDPLNKKLARIGLLIKNQTASRDTRTPEPGGLKEVYDRLKNVAQKIDRRSILPDTLLTDLNKILTAIQSEQMQHMRMLRTRLETANFPDFAVTKPPSPENFSGQDLKKLKKMLDRMFKHRIPVAINRQMAHIFEYERLKKLISQIVDDLNATESEKDVLKKIGPDQDLATARNRNASRLGLQDQTDKPFGRSSGQRIDRNNVTPAPGSGPGADNGEADRPDHEFEDGGSLSAGNAQSNGQKNDPSEIDKIKGPGIQNKMPVAPKEQYSLHVRSLLAIGRAQLKQTDVIRSYRQELESILQKEDIPLNYREYIKNYFIAIGVKKGKNQP